MNQYYGSMEEKGLTIGGVTDLIGRLLIPKRPYDDLKSRWLVWIALSVVDLATTMATMMPVVVEYYLQ